MKTTIILTALTIGLLTACASSESNSEAIKAEVRIDENSSSDEFEILDENDYLKYISDKRDSSNVGNSNKFRRKPKFVNRELPKYHTQRNYITGLGPLTYKINELPGALLKYDKKEKNYRIVSLKRLVKGGVYPKPELIEDGIIYSQKINSKASFNGSVLIGGLSVGKESILELIIQDVINVIIADDLVDKEKVEAIAKKLSKSERKNYYYVKGATLTLVNNKKFTKQRLTTKVNTSYVTAEGEAYRSDEEFARERLVSVDLISLEDLMNIIGDDIAKKQ